MNNPRRNLGFTLLEVLIAVVVLATGLLALTALQGALIRSGSDAKARSQIATYAASALDRMRSGDALADATSSPTGTDELSLAANAAGVSTLEQVVTTEDYRFDGTSFTPGTATGGEAGFQRVKLTLSWTDATGGTRELEMLTDVSPMVLDASKVLVDRVPPDDAGQRPIVRRESPEMEGMIPIATGGADEEATAATNPKPQLVGGRDGTYVSDTRFDILTYSSDSPSDSFVRFNKRIETAVVGCRCQSGTAGFPTSGNDYLNAFLAAKAFRPAYWDGRGYTDPEPAAAAVDSSPSTVSQSELCDICCRDHKDPDGVAGPKFSPWPGQESDHDFLADSPTEYLEACRVIRVNGVFRVVPDPKILDNALVATEEHPAQPAAGARSGLPENTTAATDHLISDAGKAAYTNYAYDSVWSLYYDESSILATGNTTDFAVIQEERGLNGPIYVPMLQDDKRWLHSRAFMMDYLEADAITTLKKAAAECTGTEFITQAQCLLPWLPMASINTTEISNWSQADFQASDPRPAGLESVDVARLDYARSGIRPHNTGLALYAAINTTEAAMASVMDRQVFVQVGAADPATAQMSTPSPNPSTTRLFGGDLANGEPLRGYAQTCGSTAFNLSIGFPTGGNPRSPTADSDRNNDPGAIVGNGCACTPRANGNTANPYSCRVGDSSAFELKIAGYNRFVPENVTDPCTGRQVTKDVLYCYANAPTTSITPGTYSISPAGVSGTGLSQIRTYNVSRTSATDVLSSITLTFGAHTSRVAPQGTCVANVAQWTVPTCP